MRVHACVIVPRECFGAHFDGCPERGVMGHVYVQHRACRNAGVLLLPTAHSLRHPMLCQVTFQPRQIFEPFDINVKGGKSDLCPRVSSVAEVDPKLDAVLKRCTGGAPWTSVAAGTNTIEVSKYINGAQTYDMKNFQYNSTYATVRQPGIDVEPIGLPVPREFTFMHINGWGSLPFEHEHGVGATLSTGVRPGDVLMVNLGAHYSRVYTFDMWRDLIDKSVTLFKEHMAAGIVVVWRSSFVMKEHVFRSYSHADGYVPQAHFNTDHRRLMFDSYAEEKLTEAKVPMWDVGGMSSMGDYKPHDMVHSDGATCWAMNHDMMDLFACFD